MKNLLPVYGIDPDSVDTMVINSWKYVDGVLHVNANVKMKPKSETITIQINVDE